MLFLLAACAVGPGQGFGELREATLAAALVPGAARDLGGGEILTQDGYAVRVDRFELTLGEVELLALSGGGGGGTFDPADPPEGYSLCHGGHCHAADGSLVDYADVEAAMAGGAASFAPVVTLPVEAAADLVGGAAYTLDVTGFDLLPAADITKLELGVSRIVLEGAVRHHPDDGWSAPLTVDLAASGALGAGLELPLARGEDPAIVLAISVEPDGTLFDGLDLAALEGAEGIVLDDLDDPGAVELAGAVLAVEPGVVVERSP